ncbi:hypothetical protein CHS0354_030096 [Potamilus streckersoni]|uniref:4Fe-4S ferredoxin-type domain-containing protein n=1 Tax=Potamilus streckersoni TaxID=2493646 RepID=A0AAE0RLQ1_9BIVA|nr:hypothetical protein CHS0354_030096 [Potamilus streckersoni]
MASLKQRYEDNTEGPFYVDRDCIYCGLCAEIAPKNFAPSPEGDHDIVIKQPQSPEESRLCKEAQDSCPVEAIGDDASSHFFIRCFLSNKKFISGVVDFVFGSHYFQKYAYGKKFPPELESIRSRQIRKRVTLLMVAVLIALYFFNRNYRDFLPDNFGYTELIIGLFPINLNLILLILIGFLLLRNLIKIIYERKQRLFGYKLKVKIMAGFFISGIIPVAIYFSATQGFFSNSFHTWFKDKLNSAISGSDDILEAYKGLMQDDLAHYALLTVQNAPEKLTDIKNKHADTFLSQKIYEYRLSGAAFYDSSFNLLTSRFENDALREAWKPVKPEQIKFEGLLKPGFIFELTPQGAVSRSIVAFENNGQTYYLELIRAEADTGRRLYPTVKNTLTLFLGLSSLEPLVTKTYNYYVLTLTMMIIGWRCGLGFIFRERLLHRWISWWMPQIKYLTANLIRIFPPSRMMKSAS